MTSVSLRLSRLERTKREDERVSVAEVLRRCREEREARRARGEPEPPPKAYTEQQVRHMERSRTPWHRQFAYTLRRFGRVTP